MTQKEKNELIDRFERLLNNETMSLADKRTELIKWRFEDGIQ